MALILAILSDLLRLDKNIWLIIVWLDFTGPGFHAVYDLALLYEFTATPFGLLHLMLPRRIFDRTGVYLNLYLILFLYCSFD